MKKDEDVNEPYRENRLHGSEDGAEKYYESSKDINAKVAYQYPKGQFRFPLIPDDEPKKNSNNERIPREKRNERVSQKPEKKQVQSRVSHQSQRDKHDNSQVRAKVSQTTRRGPFRPTEIPSPIYGFNRPNLNVEKTTQHKEPDPIEYELNVPESSFYEENDLLIDSLPKLAPLEPETSYDETVEFDNFYENDRESKLFSEEESLDAEVLDNPTVSVDEVEHEHIHKQAEVSEEITVEPQPDFSHEVEEENVEKSPISTPERRRHIPFNVMMLNQDKQRLKQLTNVVVEEKEAPLISQEKQELADSEATVNDWTDNNESIMYYQFPADELLTPPVIHEETSEWLDEQEKLLNSTLTSFNVGAKVVNVTQGPSVTRYEVQPDPGVKVNKITNLADDIKLSLAAKDIRIEAPIPGKHTIGIEVPNKKSRPVFISEIINSSEFKNSGSPLTAVLGLDIAGNPIVTDLRKMPHGLIAGATGSGKSVCINSILVSLLFKANPDDVKLILIDPKMVELAPYNGIPHLVSPVITDVKAATAALKWAVDEMERRYELFAHTGVREIRRFNELAEEHKRYAEKLPYIVIIIDELADLMMMSPADVEEAICRIAQKARACGIHLIIATQRPSVDVITGLIKANVPTRIAFSVSSQIDSRTIIDISGAEKLLGRGDMLFLENGSSKPVRLQGTFVSDQEIDDVVAHVKRERAPEYLFEQEELLKKAQVIEEEDELFYEACEFVVDQGAASTSSLQRRFKIGYNRAARLIDMMEQQGFISEGRGSKPREVHLTGEELEALQDTSTLI